MNILIVGLTIVIGGIVFARLPAFLALTLGAVLVAWLTPREAAFNAFISRQAAQVGSVDGNLAELSRGEMPLDTALIIAPQLKDSEESVDFTWKAKAFFEQNHLIPDESTSFHAVRAGDVVLTREHVEDSLRRTHQRALTRVTIAMGECFAKLAIIIVCASIIGHCLLGSGSTERIVRSMLGLLGQRLAPAALTVSSFVLGIPVFFDTVFYLMIPIANVLCIQTGGNFFLYVLAIVAGVSMTHSLVPPTPGPLAVAEMFEVELSQMILGGVIVGMVAASAGLLWASIMNRIFTLNVQEDDTTSLEATAQKDKSELLPVWLALLPVALPVMLISLVPVLEMISPELARSGSYPIMVTLSDKNVALLISAGIALAVYLWNARPSKQSMSEAMQSAVGSAGAILLITCAGGAFGRICFKRTCPAC